MCLVADYTGRRLLEIDASGRVVNSPLKKGEAPKRQWSRRRGGCLGESESQAKRDSIRDRMRWSQAFSN
jgi:hypothetical protein